MFNGFRAPIVCYIHPTTKHTILRSSRLLPSQTQSSKSRVNEDNENFELMMTKLGCSTATIINVVCNYSYLKNACYKKGPNSSFPSTFYTEIQIPPPLFISDCVSEVIYQSGLLYSISAPNSDATLYHLMDVVGVFLSVALQQSQAICNIDGLTTILIEDSGMDYTLLLSSLIHVLTLSEARTITGFVKLINREWIIAGHPFSSRHFKCSSLSGYSDQGSCILLFLLCVYQLIHQFPTAFEFTEKFLRMIFDSSFSTKYGNFLMNCQADRDKSKLEASTSSLWTHLDEWNSENSEFKNYFYTPASGLIQPITSPQLLEIWDALFVDRVQGASSSSYTSSLWESISQFSVRK